MDNRRSRNHFVLCYLVRILARLVTLERLANGAKLDLVMLGHQIRDSSITCTLLWMPAATQHVRHEGILILMQSVQGVVIFTAWIRIRVRQSITKKRYLCSPLKGQARRQK